MNTHRALTLLAWIALPSAALGQNFIDDGAAAGVSTRYYNSAYASWGDFDGDGYQDVFLGINGGSYEPNDILYRNLGNGIFSNVAAQAGVKGHSSLSFQKGAAWGDYDRDGDLDLFVTCTLANELFRNNGDGTFTDVAVTAGVDVSTGPSCAAWGDVDGDGWPDVIVANWNNPEQLYINQGDGTFVEIAVAAGCDGGNSPTSGVMFVDYDGDGNLDIYTSIPGQGTQNALYKGDGNLSFTDVTTASGLKFDSSWDSSWGDCDNDGDMDLFVSEMTPPSTDSGRHYLNQGNGTFIDVGAASGLEFTHALGQNARGSSWADYDNDGNLDLYVVFNLTSAGSLPATNYLFRNNGDGTFTDVAAASGTADGSLGNGMAWADYNEDGFLDLYVINEWNFNCNLYRNLGNANHWTRIYLNGIASDTHGLGARVRAKSGGVWHMREVTGGGTGKGSQDDYPVEFGFGTDTIIQELEVRWPSGTVDTYTNLPVDQKLYLWEGGEVGTSYCGPAVANSSGAGAEIHAWGSNVVAGNALVLQATQMPVATYGYFLVSPTQGFVSTPGGSQGNLCLGGNIGRFAYLIRKSSNAGSFDISVDITNLPGQGVVLPGDTLNFQAWFRDKNPGSTSNFTDGTSITFL